MTDTTEASSDITIYYYNWEGDACQVHLHTNGDLVGYIYHAGKGLTEIAASDITDSARQVGEEEYKKLVMRITARTRRNEQDYAG